jgi:hypothetical protein
MTGGWGFAAGFAACSECLGVPLSVVPFFFLSLSLFLVFFGMLPVLLGPVGISSSECDAEGLFAEDGQGLGKISTIGGDPGLRKS